MDYGALDIMQQMGLQSHIKVIAKGQGNSFCPTLYLNSKIKIH